MTNSKTLASHRAKYEAALRKSRAAYKAWNDAERDMMNAPKSERRELVKIADRADAAAMKAQLQLERIELDLLRYMLAGAPKGLAQEAISAFRTFR